MTILKEFLAQDAPARVRVLNGEDTDAARRGDKKPVVRSKCTYYCPDEATARRCIEALEESDRRLRERPDELMLWDWQATYFEAEQDNANGGGTVILGVACTTRSSSPTGGTPGSASCTSASTRTSASRWRTSRSPTGG